MAGEAALDPGADVHEWKRSIADRAGHVVGLRFDALVVRAHLVGSWRDRNEYRETITDCLALAITHDKAPLTTFDRKVARMP